MSKVHDILVAGMLRDFLRDELGAVDANEMAGSAIGNIQGVMGLHRTDTDKFIAAARKRLRKLEKEAQILSDRRRDWYSDIEKEAARMK